jgi:STE24 endopeptidase
MYQQFILITLLLSYGISVLSEFLNLKALQPAVPEEFADIYDARAYARSQEYTKEKIRFSVFSETIHIIALLCFWFMHGFAAIDIWTRSFGYGSIITGLLFFAALAVLDSIVSLPFSIYSTFVLEQKYGFNRTKPLTFIMDRIKGIALGAILGAPIMALIILFFEIAGANAWWMCWAAITVFTLAIQFIAPTWIMPLFNKFTPLADGSLRSKLLEYANSVQFPLQGIFVIDGSRRSARANAFFTGFGKNKRIALYDTLINNHTEQELMAVLAHEVGHYKKRHIVQSMVLSILQTGILFFILSFFLGNQQLFQAFYVENISIHAGMVFFFMLYAPISTITGIAMNIFSRKNEYEADEYAAKTTHDPGAMIAALKKLSADNLSNLTPHPFYVFLNYSHPTALQRIQALRNIVLH